MRTESRKHLLHYTDLDEVFPKTPDAGGIRDFLTDVQTEKTSEGVPVEDLKFGRVVRQVLQRLHRSPSIGQRMVWQIASCVRWCEIVTSMLNNGVDTFIEVGPMTVLKGMMRKIVP